MRNAESSLAYRRSLLLFGENKVLQSRLKSDSFFLERWVQR